jgi:hypothetical protein
VVHDDDDDAAGPSLEEFMSNVDPEDLEALRLGIVSAEGLPSALAAVVPDLPSASGDPEPLDGRVERCARLLEKDVMRTHDRGRANAHAAKFKAVLEEQSKFPNLALGAAACAALPPFPPRFRTMYMHARGYEMNGTAL